MAPAANKRCCSVLQYVGLILAVLTLSHSSVAQSVFCTHLNDAFATYTCECRQVVTSDGTSTLDVILDCSNRNLASVPVRDQSVSLPSTLVIYEFILANNSITQLEEDSFQGLKVRALDLSGNSISKVSDFTFFDLGEHLRELKMDGDLSGGPSKVALGTLTGLEVLALGDYNVQFLGDDEHLYFLSLVNLKHLTLREWNIGVIEPDAFKGPTSLQSLTLTKETNLFGLPLAVLRQDSLKSLTSLKISVTSIQEVSEDAFSELTNLEELDLSDNRINQIRLNSLKGLGSLKKLSFASNNLSSETSTLDGLSNLSFLEELDLSGNEDIKVIPDFSQLNPAQQTSVKIFIKNNNINSLPPDAFTGRIAQRLHTLDLSQNNISSIDQASFNGVTNLQVLRLSQQRRLASVALALPDSLSQFSGSLTHLFLDGQTLDELALWQVLPLMAKLEVLDLSETGLSRLRDWALQNMTGLQELYLNGNALTSLDQANLVGPRFTLKKLYLNQNPLRRISSCVFANYTSFPITMALQSAPLVCDCSLAWLYQDAKDNKIQFPTDHAPKCSNHNNELLLSKSYDLICTISDYSDPPCENPYTTPSSPPIPGPPSLTLNMIKITSDSITLSWSLSKTMDTIRSFDVRITNNYGDSEYRRDNLAPRFLQVEATSLLADTQHKVCVIANFKSINSVTACTFTRTEKGNDSGSSGQTGDSDSEDPGIIIGAVVGAVLLLVVLAAIGYLVIVRRRPKKGSDSDPAPGPIQPRNFAKSELPSMTDDSRTFTRPKRPLDHHDGMQVVAISDGQVNDRHARNGSARVGRAAMLNSDGSYKLMSAGASSTGGTSTTGSVSGSQSLYENDRGLLPKTPPYHDRGLRGPRQPGYYNEAFEKDKYDEIEMPREVSL